MPREPRARSSVLSAPKSKPKRKIIQRKLHCEVTSEEFNLMFPCPTKLEPPSNPAPVSIPVMPVIPPPPLIHSDDYCYTSSMSSPMKRRHIVVSQPIVVGVSNPMNSECCPNELINPVLPRLQPNELPSMVIGPQMIVDDSSLMLPLGPLPADPLPTPPLAVSLPPPMVVPNQVPPSLSDIPPLIPAMPERPQNIGSLRPSMMNLCSNNNNSSSLPTSIGLDLPPLPTIPLPLTSDSEGCCDAATRLIQDRQSDSLLDSGRGGSSTLRSLLKKLSQPDKNPIKRCKYRVSSAQSSQDSVPSSGEYGCMLPLSEDLVGCSQSSNATCLDSIGHPSQTSVMIMDQKKLPLFADVDFNYSAALQSFEKWRLKRNRSQSTPESDSSTLSGLTPASIAELGREDRRSGSENPSNLDGDEYHYLRPMMEDLNHHWNDDDDSNVIVPLPTEIVRMNEQHRCGVNKRRSVNREPNRVSDMRRAMKRGYSVSRSSDVITQVS